MQRSGDIAVSIATGTGWGRSSSPCMVKTFLLFTSSIPVQGAHSASYPTGTASPGLMRPEREADHSYQTSAEIKKTWIYTSIPHTSSCDADLENREYGRRDPSH
jgi:hypothetical protein